MTITSTTRPTTARPARATTSTRTSSRSPARAATTCSPAPPGRDTFTGHSGNDEIHGAGGDDELSGSTGDDRMFGDAGNDKVQGYEGADTGRRRAGQRPALRRPRHVHPVLLVRRGPAVRARRRARHRRLRRGADSAQVDGLDIVAFCASVDRQNLPGAGGPGGGPSAAAALALKVGKSIKLKAQLKRGLAVRLACAEAGKVVATLSFEGKRLRAGRKTLRKAGAARLAVKVGKKARRRVRRLRGKKLTLRVKVTSAGKTTTLTRKVTLKR